MYSSDKIMNIALFDSWGRKFTQPMIEHWEKNGHKVVVNAQWDILDQSDINIFYPADNVAVEGSQKPHKGKMFVFPIDIECWAGQAQAIKWDNVDGAIFMAEHIKELVNIANTPYKVIKPGIDTNRWTLKKTANNSPVRKIAYVVGDRRIWDVKRLDIAFQLLKDLMITGQNIWQLHIRGTYSSHAQYNAYCKYLEKDLKLEGHVFWYESRIDDLNEWLEDKDYYLNPSTKEAFSYATAETMSKGIKPIINNWQGAKEAWGEFVCDTYGQMLLKFLKEPIEPEKYRAYIKDHYDQERYFDELDSFLGLKGGV